MTLTLRFSIISAFVASSFATANAQCIQRDEKVEAQVEELLSKMSLDDKVGQMCELAIDKVQTSRASSGNVLAGGLLSADAVNDVFANHKVGSILNVPQGTAQTPKAWADVIRTLNSASAEECKGVPQIYGVDQIHGASYTHGATMFPQEIGQGASFNSAIPLRVGQITAYETRACLIPWVYAPVMDLARSPLWSRMWESFGEDVLVNGIMASQLTRGLQGEDPNHVGKYNVAACLKHYLAYGAAVSGKDRTPSSVTYREMMEKFFQPFRMCCEAGALSLMVNSSNNSGMPFHCNKKVLTEWLKEGLDWDGMIVTDWADIDNLWRRDHVAANKKDAICLAINAGIDMDMDPYSTDFCQLLKELVEEGRVPMSRIDDAVRRILRLKIRVGLLDRKTWDMDYKKLSKQYPDFASDAFAAEAVKIAEECMVLLKNKAAGSSGNAVLPLKQGTKILCVGPNADNFRPMNGGWSYTWQGDKTDAIARQIGKYKSFYQALSSKFGDENVKLNKWVSYSQKPGAHWSAETADDAEGNLIPLQVEWCDVIVAFIGENSYCETPGNTDELYLSERQLNMVKRLAAFKKPVVLVLNEGRPRIIKDIEPLASAVVHTFLPGNYGGEALANLLSGEANFSGKMPYTYPKYHGSFITYDCKPCEYVETMEGAYNYDANTTVQWPFGYGLSYSEVAYSNLKVGAVPASPDGMLTFTVDVTNKSDIDVKEPVLLFVSDLVASLTPDVKRLRAFTKVELKAHETKTVSLSVRLSDLAFVDEDLHWVLEPGTFRATVGRQRVEFEVPISHRR